MTDNGQFIFLLSIAVFVNPIGKLTCPAVHASWVGCWLNSQTFKLLKSKKRHTWLSVKSADFKLLFQVLTYLSWSKHPPPSTPRPRIRDSRDFQLNGQQKAEKSKHRPTLALAEMLTAKAIYFSFAFCSFFCSSMRKCRRSGQPHARHSSGRQSVVPFLHLYTLISPPPSLSVHLFHVNPATKERWLQRSWYFTSFFEPTALVSWELGQCHAQTEARQRRRRKLATFLDFFLKWNKQIAQPFNH